MSDLQIFMEALGLGLPDDERIIAGAFQGDPDDNIGSGWRPFGCWRDDDGRWRVPGNPTYNRYVTVSAFKQNELGEWRRQSVDFGSGLALMIDDVGTGAGAKIGFAALCGLTPTALIETSPGNFQAWYMFDEPVRDEGVVRRLQDSYVDKYCGGKDTGMKGVNRVGRLPDSINGKARYNGWEVKMRAFNPACRYTPQQLADVFGISCSPLPSRVRDTVCPAEAKANMINFKAILKLLGPQIKTSPNRRGWIGITCPWLDEHTKGVDNGASIRLPDADNDWRGAFVCHHGSHKVMPGMPPQPGWKRWIDLENWVRMTLLKGATGDVARIIYDYWIHDGLKEEVDALEEANKNG